jgi:hypothetical protein
MIPKANSFFLFPQSPKQWLWVFGTIALIAAVATGTIRALIAGLGLMPIVETESLWDNYQISLFYTLIICLSQLVTGEMVYRFIPLRTKWSAAVHVMFQSVSASSAYLLASSTEHLVFNSCDVPADKSFIIAGVSFGLSFIINSFYYLMIFYRQVKEAEQAALESELKALRAQINPHFLFNTLNSIAALIRIRPDEAEHVTEELADLFRYSLRASQTPLVTLADELQSVDLYLSIERTRFGKRLRATLDIPSALLDAEIPSLLLQPLVENSIKHGASRLEGDFYIHLSAIESDGMIELIVHDSGDGFDLSLGESVFTLGTGLSNVRDRLMLLFPKEALMRLEKNAVVLCFPHHFMSKKTTHRTAKVKV